MMNTGMGMSPGVMNPIKGFTLVELMVVVAIVAILAAIGYPQYNQYTRKARRAEGINALMQVANEQEKYFNANNTYKNNDATPLESSTIRVNVPQGEPADKLWYQVTVTAVGSTFTATATARNDQVNDKQGNTPCTTLTLTNTGVKQPSQCFP